MLTINDEINENSLCEINIQNIIEVLFFLEKKDSGISEQLTLFQPDLIIQDVSYDSGKFYIAFIILK